MKSRFDTIYDLYAPMLYRIAFTYLKNKEDSEDVVQDIYIKWFHHLSFQNEEHEKAWLIRCCHNLCKNNLKKWWKQKNTDQIDLYYRKENKDEFYYVSQLPEHLKIITYLHYYEGYTSQEIGRIMEKSDSTIRTQLQQAREKIKEMIEGDRNE